MEAPLLGLTEMVHRGGSSQAADEQPLHQTQLLYRVFLKNTKNNVLSQQIMTLACNGLASCVQR